MKRIAALSLITLLIAGLIYKHYSSETKNIIIHHTHNFSKTSKDTPSEFNAFLSSCTAQEKIQMLQALQDLPSKYRTAPPEEVIDNVRAGKLDASAITSSAVRKALVWRAYSKPTYYFRSDDRVDYHAIVQWAAGKVKIPDEDIKTLSTYQLEQEVSKKFFSIVWENLTPQQRENVINEIKAKSGKGFTLSDAMAVMNYIYDIITSPYSAILSTVMYASGYIFAESDKVCVFIMTVNMIKSKG